MNLLDSLSTNEFYLHKGYAVTRISVSENQIAQLHGNALVAGLAKLLHFRMHAGKHMPFCVKSIAIEISAESCYFIRNRIMRMTTINKNDWVLAINYDSWAVTLRINKIHYNCNKTAKFRCFNCVITCFFLLWIEKWWISFQVRLSALKMIEQIHKRIGEGYMVLLPESIPFLAELMEGN